MDIFRSMFKAGRYAIRNENSLFSDEAVRAIRKKALKNEMLYLSRLSASNNFGVEVSEVSFAEFDRRKHPR